MRREKILQLSQSNRSLTKCRSGTAMTRCGRCGRPSVRFSFPFRLMSFLFIRYTIDRRKPENVASTEWKYATKIKIDPREDVIMIVRCDPGYKGMGRKDVISRSSSSSKNSTKICQKNQDLSKQHVHEFPSFVLYWIYNRRESPLPRKLRDKKMRKTKKEEEEEEKRLPLHHCVI